LILDVVESGIDVELEMSDADKAVTLSMIVTKKTKIKLRLILPPPHNKPKYELLIRLSKSYILMLMNKII
jgi:hypothetical protein